MKSHLPAEHDFLATELGKLAAPRVTAETLPRFRSDLDRLRKQNGDSPYLRFWDEAIAAGPAAVRRFMTERSERAQVMRSVISFRAFVSKHERDELLRRHVREAAAE